jgi:hypothetical protein
MPHGQLPRDRKISKTVNAIKNCGWRTTNEFVEGFYGSREAVQSLHYQPGSIYERAILTSWMSNVPSGESPFSTLIASAYRYFLCILILVTLSQSGN